MTTGRIPVRLPPHRIRRVGCRTAARMLGVTVRAVQKAVAHDRFPEAEADSSADTAPWRIPICCVRAAADKRPCPVHRWGDRPDPGDLETLPE